MQPVFPAASPRESGPDENGRTLHKRFMIWRRNTPRRAPLAPAG